MSLTLYFYGDDFNHSEKEGVKGTLLKKVELNKDSETQTIELNVSDINKVTLYAESTLNDYFDQPLTIILTNAQLTPK